MPNAAPPIAAPTPIPALAPVDRPPLSPESLCVAVVEAEALDDEASVVVGEDVAEPELDEGAMVGTGSPKNSAIVKITSPALPSQQSFVLPQHHFADLSVPSHGVTLISPDRDSCYTQPYVVSKSLPDHNQSSHRRNQTYILSANVQTSTIPPIIKYARFSPPSRVPILVYTPSTHAVRKTCIPGCATNRMKRVTQVTATWAIARTWVLSAVGPETSGSLGARQG